MILAENLSCEPYLETGNRNAFANTGPTTDVRPTYGWHTPEQAVRWTNGKAGIAIRGTHGIASGVEMTGHYWTPHRGRSKGIFSLTCARRAG